MNTKAKMILLAVLSTILIMIASIYLSNMLPETFNQGRTSYQQMQAGWLTIDPQGRPWVAHNEALSKGGTDNLIILDVLNGDSWTTYRQGVSVSPVSGIRALASDRQGNIWIGT